MSGWEMPTNTSEQLLELLGSHPWEDTIPRLVAHASKKSKRLFWRGIYGGHLPEGKEVEDLVNQAIDKIISGQRQWDPDTNPDLFLFLRGIVDSDLNHLAESEENRYVRSETVSVAGSDCDEEEKEISVITSMPTPNSDPEETLLLREEETRCEEFFWNFYGSLDGKHLLQKIVECIWDDVEKPADIAEKLGVPVNDIYNARKQLQRRLDEYRNTK